MTLLEEIKEVLRLMEKDGELTDAEKEVVYTMQRRFASRLPSPSALNALSVLKSNSAEKLAAWLTQEEG